MKLGRTTPLPEATFDLTSMIDVVLLLIIFFVMTAQFHQSTARPMDLPRQPGEGPLSQNAAPAAVVIDMDVEGRCSVLGAPQEIADLARAIAAEQRRALSRGEPLDVIVRADRRAAAAALNRLAAALAAEAINNWKLATIGGDTSLTASPIGGAQ